MLSTLRLECAAPEGTATGTGFIWSFPLSDSPDTISIPAIVTNKHVVAHATQLSTTISLVAKETHSSLKEDFSGVAVEHKVVVISDLQDKIVHHPSPDVDLCALPIEKLVNSLQETYSLRHVFLNANYLLEGPDKELIHSIEPIVMIGYPNGLWDEVNNLPIARTGRAATHALVKWQGRSEFLVDTACFPGSSGSPVFLFQDGMFRSSMAAISPGTLIAFLGILWGGSTMSISGSMTPRAIPTSANDVPKFDAMLNLGFVVNSDEILILQEQIRLHHSLQ
jgi:Trypsin-like peptidase domain